MIEPQKRMTPARRKQARDKIKRQRQRQQERERIRAVANKLRERERAKLNALLAAERKYKVSQQGELSQCRKAHSPTSFLSANKYAQALILWTAKQDENGRNVGLAYSVVLELVRERFPIITYKGPHTGKPIKMTVKQLREIAYTMQSEDRSLRLPVRPRSNRKKNERVTRATIAPQKVKIAMPGSTAPLKG